MRDFTRTQWVFLMLISSALGFHVGCVDEYSHCKKLEHLCDDKGSAGRNMMKFCKSTCNNCPKDACVENNGYCEQNCDFDGKKNYCSCRRGFTLNTDNQTCTDVNECADEANACPGLSRKYCKNTNGSYSCDTCSHSDGYMMYYKASTCCKVSNRSCGYDSTMDPVNKVSKLARIFGGLMSENGKWPWMVQLIEQTGGERCGGSLLSHVWVLTAAHCFWEFSTIKNWRAILGTNQNFSSLDWNSRGIQIRGLVQVIKHSDNNFFYHHDIALAKLGSPVDYSYVIRPICLPCIERPQEGDICWTAGFGQTGGKGSNTLQEVDLPITSTSYCAKVYSEKEAKFRSDHMICAGREKGKDACYGDSGGPLMCQRNGSCQWYQAGIISFGLNGCGLEGVPGVYTSIAAHQDWIIDHIGTEDAAGVCPDKACQGIVDKSTRCWEDISYCSSYPAYMGENCAKTCCKERHDIRSKSCEDHPVHRPSCRKNMKHCRSRIFSRFMNFFCKKTCSIC